jgi:ATP-binding protein involved in chromosome partitioning
MNLNDQPELDKQNLMIPLRNYNVNCMSMGFLVDEKAAIVWRGLMIMQAIERLMFKVNWGDLDVLVIDMPPGTGDIQLSISQNLILDGAICVTTPQEISLIDARKAIEMFRKVQVPVLGLVQNMNSFKCSNCGHIEHIFGKNGAISLAEESESDIIGDIPIVSKITETSDLGQPITVSLKDHQITKIYIEICEKILKKLNL